jgi:glucose 1-dehydrogenase
MSITLRLDGLRILITGAARGIGLACARRFLAEGASVLLTDIDATEGTRAVSSIGLPSDRVAFNVCDVAQRDHIALAIETCVTHFGGLDVLVNNACINPHADILTIDDAIFDRVIAVNLKAALHGTQLAARQMIGQGSGGVIINMSSVNAILNIPRILAYNISKAGLNQLTRNTAIALAPHRIRVCGIGPGTIMTDMLRASVWTDDASRKSILSRTPLGRPGEPEEVASIAAFLASKDASYVTGETIYADGGRLGLNYTVEL